MRAFLTGWFGEDPDLPLEYKETCGESCDSNVDNDYNVKDDFLLLLEVVGQLREHSSETKVSEKGSSQLITLKKIIWNLRRQSECLHKKETLKQFMWILDRGVPRRFVHPNTI